MKIGFDLDDVVVSWFSSFLKFFNPSQGTSYVLKDMTDFCLWKVGIGKTRQEAIDFVDRFYESEYFEKIPFVEGAEEGLRFLGRDNDLIFITSRSEKYRPKTERFVGEGLGRSLDCLFFSGDFVKNGRKTKADICIEQEVKHYVEDCLDYANEVANRDVRVSLLDTPWNQGRLVEGVKRVYNWKEILKHVEETRRLEDD